MLLELTAKVKVSVYVSLLFWQSLNYLQYIPTVTVLYSTFLSLL